MLSSTNNRLLSIGVLTKRTPNVPALTRSINNAELISPYKRKIPAWFRKRGARAGYPAFIWPQDGRIIGVDKNLQERLDDMFQEQNRPLKNRTDIGFPPQKIENPTNNRAKMIEYRRQQRSNLELEKAARLKELVVSLDQVKAEHYSCGGLYKEIFEAADLYGIFEDLYGSDKFFRPNVLLKVHYDFDQDYVTPVYRGNIIKPKEAQTCPAVSFELPKTNSEDSLWTLVMTNLDGHFTDENSEYLHWMVGNIPGNNFSAGNTVVNYLQPFPAYGTGYHRFVFVLYKQAKELDLSEYKQPDSRIDLSRRTFRTQDFMTKFEGQLTPAGLGFFQSDYDSSVKRVFHDVLEMREPRFEYNFIPHYIRPWLTEVPEDRSVPFNVFLDKMRDPKDIQEEVLKKKLKTVHPFKGDLERHLKFRNAHGPQFHRYQDQEVHGSWRLREIERERLRQGIFKDMDWTHLRRDPSDA